MSKIKIKPLDLFAGKNDVRKFLKIEMFDENREYLKEEYDVCEELIHEMLETASIYVDMSNVNELIELEVTE